MRLACSLADHKCPKPECPMNTSSTDQLSNKILSSFFSTYPFHRFMIKYFDPRIISMRRHYHQCRTDHLIHFCQAIYALVDQLVSSRPWIVGHWWVCFPVPILYVVFNVSYWAGGGTNEVSLNQRE